MEQFPQTSTFTLLQEYTRLSGDKTACENLRRIREAFF